MTFALLSSVLEVSDRKSVVFGAVVPAVLVTLVVLVTAPTVKFIGAGVVLSETMGTGNDFLAVRVSNE